VPAALALNGVSMNASRIIGPLAAGAIIAAFGSAWVFALNAGLSLMAGFVIMRWRREHKESPLGRERLGSAIRVGPAVRAGNRPRPAGRAGAHRPVLLFIPPRCWRSCRWFARGLPGGSAGTFHRAAGVMGSGAIVAALAIVRIRSLMRCSGC